MKRAQILLITLIVLSIIGIITVSIVILVQRDTAQVTSSENYEEAYNASEGHLNELLNKYSDRLIPLDQLLSDFGDEDGGLNPDGAGGGDGREGSQSTGGNDTPFASELQCTQQAAGGFLCQVENDEFSNLDLKTEISVNELNYLKEYPLYKDRTIDLALGAYTDEITVSWDKDSAIEFTLVYQDGGGQMQLVKDIYDPLNLYYQHLGQYDHILDHLGVHPFDFVAPLNTDLNHSVKFILRNVKGVNGSAVSGTLKYLRITNRNSDNNQAVLLNLNATGPNSGTFPKQVREFVSRSFNTSNLVTPIANLKTIIPLHAQPESLFDYAIITKDEINF